MAPIFHPDIWIAGAVANFVIMTAYLAIAVAILVPISRNKDWRRNPLGTATGAIFVSCGVGHGIHMAHLLLPIWGLEVEIGMAARRVYREVHVWAWDAVTAGVAIWYWTLRSRFPALVRGAALFEDIRQRQHQALEIHDNVVQGLAQAKLEFEMGRGEQGLRSVERTLAASRRIITDLLGPEGSEAELGPGKLKRDKAAGGKR